MVEVVIRENIQEMMNKVGDEMTPQLAKVLLKAATFAGGHIQESVDATFPGGTGALARSFLPARFVQTDEGVAAAAVSDLPYANIQDRGGEVIPDGNALAIPLTNKAKNMWPRDWPDKELFVFVSKKTGNAFLAERMGKKGALARALSAIKKRLRRKKALSRKPRKPRKAKKTDPPPLHYLLRESVDIPPTDYLGRAMQAAEGEINEIIEAGVQNILDKADEKKGG